MLSHVSPSPRDLLQGFLVKIKINFDQTLLHIAFSFLPSFPSLAVEWLPGRDRDRK